MDGGWTDGRMIGHIEKRNNIEANAQNDITLELSQIIITDTQRYMDVHKQHALFHTYR